MKGMNMMHPPIDERTYGGAQACESEDTWDYLELDGWWVQLFRSHEGKMTVAINTEDGLSVDHHENTEVPKLRVWINETEKTLDRNGEWK